VPCRACWANQGRQFRAPSLSLSQYSGRQSCNDNEDDFSFGDHGPENAHDDPGSQWESDGPSPELRRETSSSSTPNIRSQKSAMPSSVRMYPKSPKQSTISNKLHLSPKDNRKLKLFYSSRASSASYNGAPVGEQKAPLVLLHITLLFLPGAEEAILRKITPTMLERGLLVEHPRNDYNLLEELVIDSLGLDDSGNSDDEDESNEWEQSLGVRRVKAKSSWDLRVYAANGLMTPGAWKRVWGEMERVDVEVGPKGWRGNKVSYFRSAYQQLQPLS
jgi:hypothetical protein